MLDRVRSDKFAECNREAKQSETNGTTAGDEEGSGNDGVHFAGRKTALAAFHSGPAS